MKKILASIAIAASFFAAQANADIVFGLGGQGSIYEGDSVDNLWTHGDYIAHSASPVNWQNRHRYFAADGYVYGVGDRLFRYNSAEDMWNGTNETILGFSAVGWNNTYQYMAHDGKYYAIAGTNLYEATSAVDLWNGNYSASFAIAGGWSHAHSYFMNSDGVYAVAGNTLYNYETVQDFVTNTNLVSLGTSPANWSNGNTYFSDNSTPGINLNADGSLKVSDVSTPIGLATLALPFILAGFRRKR